MKWIRYHTICDLYGHSKSNSIKVSGLSIYLKLEVIQVITKKEEGQKGVDTYLLYVYTDIAFFFFFVSVRVGRWEGGREVWGGTV